MNAVTDNKDYVIADLGLAGMGVARKIRSPETEMPRLMAIREEFAKTQPVKGRASPAACT